MSVKNAVIYIIVSLRGVFFTTKQSLGSRNTRCRPEIENLLRLLRSLRSLAMTQLILISSFGLLFGQESLKTDLPAADSSQAESPKVVLNPEEILQQSISLDLRNIDIIEAIKFLSAKTGLNIIATKSVTGRISLSVNNVIVKDVFDVMLRSNALAYVLQGNIYNIMTEEEYKNLYGGGFFDSRRVRVFQLKYSSADQASALIDTLKSSIGRVIVEAESGRVLVLDTPEKIKLIETVLSEFDRKNVVEVITLQYAKAIEVEEILKSQLDLKKIGSVKADERNNQIVVQTLPEKMQEIKQIIKNLDRQTKEVLIETQIVRIKLSKQMDQGFEWEGIFNVASKNGLTYVGSYPFSAVQATSDAWRSRTKVFSDLGGNVGSYPFSGTSTNFAASAKTAIGDNMHVGMVNSKQDFDTFIKYLQTLGKTRILSNPKIVAVNNQEAKIHVGEKQAYVTTTTTTGSSTNTISEDVTFVDVGIQLSVTPTINDDGFITMKVKPEVSSVTSILTTSTGNKIPIIDTALSETTVLIKDNTTLIIGGLRKEEKSDTTQQVPFLGQIPLLGFFFKQSSTKTDRTELLVLMTPHIISGDRLVTGNDKDFDIHAGKDYRSYEDLAVDFKDKAIEPEKIEVPAGTLPKEYRDVDLYGGNAEKLPIKETRYDVY